jgi:hypothetical protein
VNAILREAQLGVEVAAAGEDRGRVIHVLPAALDLAVAQALEVAPTGFESEVAHAVALFRSRSRDAPTLRSAVVALAGVLEAHRSLVKEELLSGDEGALFQIANNFALRHRKADQRSDYDPVFLEWLFHWYVATISLVKDLFRRPARNATATRPGDTLS